MLRALILYHHRLTKLYLPQLTGVECGRKNPFDEFSNVRRVRAEHFQSLKHNLEVLLRHNVVIRDRLKIKCSKSEPKPLDNHKHSHENCNYQSQAEHNEDLDVFIGEKDDIIKQGHTASSNNVFEDQASENMSRIYDAEQNQPTLKSNLLEDIEVRPHSFRA